MATTTSTSLNNLLSTYFSKKAIPRLVPQVVLYEFAEKTPLPRTEGLTVVFNGFQNIAAVTGSITEGTNPAATTISSSKKTGTIAQYGKTVAITDLIEMSSSLDVISNTVDNLTDSAAQSVEQVIFMALFKATMARNVSNTIMSAWMTARVSAFHGAGTYSGSTQTWGFPVVFGTTATRLSAVSKTAPSVSARMSLYAMRKAVTELKAKNAKPFADGFYKFVANSSALQDLRSDPSFVGWLQYGDNQVMKNAEATVPLEGCRVYQDNNLPTYRATAHNVDISFVFGQGAYGITELQGGARGFEIIIKRSGDGDTSNALNLYMTAGYKFASVAVALNVSAGRTLFTHAKP